MGKPLSYEDLKKIVLANNNHLDEGIEMMQILAKKLLAFEYAIKKHKAQKEKTPHAILNEDEQLWEFLEEETFG